MKLGEKIEKELNNSLPYFGVNKESWVAGFRTGFRRGYAFAHKEAIRMKKGIKPEIELP